MVMVMTCYRRALRKAMVRRIERRGARQRVRVPVGDRYPLVEYKPGWPWERGLSPESVKIIEELGGE